MSKNKNSNFEGSTDTQELLKFPSENPNPVLRIAKDSKVLYSNKPGQIFLDKWNWEIGKKLPKKWKILITETFASGNAKEIEEEVDGRFFSITIAPIKGVEYANLYALDISKRKSGEKSLQASNQQLKAINQQLTATEQQLMAANQKLKADEQQLKAANQQLKAKDQQLRASNQQLQADQEQLKKLHHDSIERIKELNCTFGLAELIEQYKTDTEHIFEGLIELMLHAWQYPEITTARVIIDGIEYKSANFRITKWLQSADILVSDKKAGSIEVCYTEKKPDAEDGPFLVQERNLLNSLARRLGRLIEHRKAAEAIASANQQLRASNQQLQAVEQQLRAANQQLRAEEQQLKALNQQLKANEINLKESEARYRSLVESSSEHIFMLSLDGVYLTSNDRVGQFGVGSGKSLIGRHLRDIYPPEVARIYQKQLKKVITKGKSIDFEHLMPEPDAEHFHLDTLYPIYRGSELYAVGGICRDITDKVLAERELRLRDRAIDSCMEGISIVDAREPDKPVIYVNQGFEQITGYKGDDVLGKNMRFLQGKATDPQKIDQLRQAIEKGLEITVEVLNYRKDGSEFWNRVAITPIHDETDTLTHFIAVHTDISEGKKAEEEILRNHKQLRMLTSKLSLAEEQERKKIAEGIHDSIIQPLVFIDIKVKSLDKITKKTELTDTYGEMRKMLGSLIEKARTFTFDLSEPILYELGLEHAIEEYLQTEIEEKHDTKTDFEFNLQTQDLDQSIIPFLYKSVKELLVNVLKHADADDVAVSITQTKNDVVICVKDNGCGFKADVGTKGKNLSAGFGLFNIREKASYLGGNLEIDSKADVGSQVTLTVPLKARFS